MWKQLIRCSIIGGVVVFLWYTIAWVVLPMHKMTLHTFTDQAEVSSAITKYAPYDGIYVSPGMDTQQQPNQPFIFMNVRRGIDFSNMIRPMVMGLIFKIISAALITYLLLQTKALRYWNRVWFVTIIGVIIGVAGLTSEWNWWHFPTAWTLLEIVDTVIAWFLGGLVIAKLVK